MGLPKPPAIMIAVSLSGDPLCRWPWWMFHVFVGSYVSFGRCPYRRAFNNTKGSFTLPAEPSRTEPNRTGPSLTERVHWLMFVFTRQPTTDSVAQ